jgi:hypothetical protein
MRSSAQIRSAPRRLVLGLLLACSGFDMVSQLTYIFVTVISHLLFL